MMFTVMKRAGVVGAVCAMAMFPVAAFADNGWNEDARGTAINLSKSRLVYENKLNTPQSLNGPVLWAKQRTDVGMETFDAIGGAAYQTLNGALALRAYKDSSGLHGGNVQSVNTQQAYDGKPIMPGSNGYTCTGCYFEVSARFPDAYGTWASFWLLTPDNPKQRGHLEVDAIEYYGAADKRGHHHTIHRWGPQEAKGHTYRSDYTGMNAIADFGWHTYGADLRGIAKLNGKPAVVIYMDGKEVGRTIADADFFTRPFYFNMTLSINPKDKQWTFPQTVYFDNIKVWK